MVNIKRISETEIPMSILLHADPSELCIGKYLPQSTCFGAFTDSKLVGVCVTNRNDAGVWEIFNISVVPEKQKQGIGTRLMKSVIIHFVDTGAEKLELGTGTFGYQLLFYQRFGFRVKEIRENFFLDNYSDPIYDHGVQLKDMLRLSLTL
ncbi:MAG: GNAT family N-acetyltransferase [Deltaproteobacteria bacterium]|nr:GNAT family N-acetyltransferase [Deltaproteobacteria bacterium]